jgi:hypothetical protein
LTRVLDSLAGVGQRLWTVREFGQWAGIDPHEVYRQISLNRVPGVIRFGRAIRIDPDVAIPELRGAGGDAA